MIGAPLLVGGLLLVLSALLGARARERSRGAAATFLLSPLHPATWYATGAILAGFWVGLFAFVVVVGLFSSGASLLFIGIGLVLFGLAIEASRLFARFERARARLADPRPLLPHVYRPYGSDLRQLVLAVYADPSRWRDVVYAFVALPLVVLEFSAVALLWGLALGLMALPLWQAMPPPGIDPAWTAGWPAPGAGWPSIDPTVLVIAGTLAGVLLAMVAASTSRGLMVLHRAVVAGLLCASEQQALARRVETLETSRRAVIDTEAGELRRIERDLHDGAQQRLVRLSMDLGLAAEKIDTDPVLARALVVEAQDQARMALAELRDLVRGIAPAILLDRGLVPALAALAARSPVPTTVSSTLPDGERLPDAAERAAYFVVAEALANVSKHAAASHCTVRCRREGELLIVEIEDDGAGGARVALRGGLAGLAGRVGALDGFLTVDSPDGGPTIVRASIPAPAAPAPPATYWTVGG